MFDVEWLSTPSNNFWGIAVKDALGFRIRKRSGDFVMLNDRENVLKALREKPLKVFEVMKRANVANQEACQSLLLKMRDEGLVKFDIHGGRWLIA